MDWLNLLHDLFFDYTLRTVALGSATLGVVSGVLGSYAVLRKQSLLGDAISHAALPGVVLAFLLLHSKASLVLIIGATVAGWLATSWMMNIINNTRIKEDSALGLVLSVFFGFGLVLLTFAQRLPDSRQAGLNKFLFGQAAALMERDVITMAVISGIVLLFVMIFWKEFKLLSFDRDFGASLGYPVHLLDVFLTGLLVIAIVIGLQAVGVVLMSAMIVAPASAARQWTDRLGKMIVLSGFFGGLAGVSGAMISSIASGLSTGPVIVLSASVIVLFSMLFASKRGLVWEWLKQRRNRKQLRLQQVLLNLYYMAGQHEDTEHPHSVSALRVMAGKNGIRASLQALSERGLVRHDHNEHWALTSKGIEKAQWLQDLHSGNSSSEVTL